MNNTFDLILPVYNFLPTYAQKLVADVPDEQMCAQPVAGVTMNHAAWTLAHLAWANDNALPLLGRERACGDWKDLCGMGSKPQNDRSVYPPKPELLAAFNAAHQSLGQAATAATPEMLSQPAPDRMRARFPTVAHMLTGLMTSHFGNHLGQLSAWRRAMGFPSVF